MHRFVEGFRRRCDVLLTTAMLPVALLIDYLLAYVPLQLNAMCAIMYYFIYVLTNLHPNPNPDLNSPHTRPNVASLPLPFLSFLCFLIQ